MAEQGMVSVITVCYNSAATIARTIESVLSQSWTNIEYIIVDGQSEDGTMGIIRYYEPLFMGRMIVTSEKDSGIYDAMNKGIKIAKGEWIGIINSDDYYELNAVEKIMQYKKDSLYQVCYGAIRNWKNETEESIVFYSHKFLAERMICHPGCFLTRTIYEKFGLFDIRYRVAADWDLMLRLSKEKEVDFVPVSEVLANFTLNSTNTVKLAFADTMRMLYDHHLITKRKYWYVMARESIKRLFGVD